MEIIEISSLKDENISKALNELYLLTSFNKTQYPKYTEWFYKTMIPRLFDKSGEILFVLDHFVIEGMIIIKKTLEEKKLCQIYTNPDYRNQSVCRNLLEESMKKLETEKPLITIPEFRISEFSSIINQYGWKETQEINSYNKREFQFN